MNKFEIAKLLANLHNRLLEIENRFNIKDERDVDLTLLWLKNSRIALGIEDKESEK